MKLYSAGPNISKKDFQFAQKAAANGWYDGMNLYHEKVKKKINQKFRIKYTSLFSSCTGGMTVLLKALNYKKGSEILVPEITWIGTITGLVHLGYKPIFVDVSFQDWNIDINKIKTKITKKTKAIISVDCYGNPSNKKELLKICKNYGLDLIEDSAPGIGSKYENQFCGTFGIAGVFSFQGAKPLTCGEGGAVITNDKNLYDRIEYYADHCRDRDKVLYNTDIGFKYKLSNIQAGFLLSQFIRFDQIIQKRREIFFNYKKFLKMQNLYIMNNQDNHIYNNFYVPSLVFKKNKSSKNLMKYLDKKKIPYRPFFRPMSSLPMFKSQNNKISHMLYKSGINLPAFSSMKKEQIKFVAENINFFLKNNFV